MTNFKEIKYLLNGKPIKLNKTKQIDGVKYKLKQNKEGNLYLTVGNNKSVFLETIITIVNDQL